MSMLSISADAKTIKGQKKGYLTGVLYLAPHTVSGRNVCPDSTPGCREDCLFTAGRGVMRSVHQSRVAKTQALRANPAQFCESLGADIRALDRKAGAARMTPLVRLNGTSDIPWENFRPNLMGQFPHIQFYDYTKSVARLLKFLEGRMPSNYHLTFSRSECNDSACLDVLDAGGNVAVVFDTKKGAALPTHWKGCRVIDGDVDDVRPADNSHGANGSASMSQTGVVVGLRAKGRARKDTSGFVVKA